MVELKIKEWIYHKECQKAMGYNRFIDVADSSRGEYREIKADENGFITVIAEILSETEKAIQVNLSTGNVDGSVMGWKAWISKSQIG